MRFDLVNFRLITWLLQGVSIKRIDATLFFPTGEAMKSPISHRCRNRRDDGLVREERSVDQGNEETVMKGDHHTYWTIPFIYIKCEPKTET